MVLWPPWKICNRSALMAEADAVGVGGGSCVTIVVRSFAPFNVETRVAGSHNEAGTEEKLVSLDEDKTVTSNVQDGVASRRTAVGDDCESV